MDFKTQEFKSVVAINIDINQVKVFLFQIVAGQYSLIAVGESELYFQHDPSFIIKGIHSALYHLEEITNKRFIADDKQFIIPSRKDGTGADQLILTYNGGKFLRVAIVGIMEDSSIRNAEQLVNSTYSKVVEIIGLNDPRNQNIRIDSIIRADPDIILFCGGSDQGASHSVLQMANIVSLVCKSLPFEKRPEIIYAANIELQEKICRNFEKIARTHTTKNIISSDKNEIEPDIRDDYNRVINEFRYREFSGIKDFCSFCSTSPMPRSHGIANMAKFFSHIYKSSKEVLLIDISSDSTTMATAKSGHTAAKVIPFGTDFGYLAEMNINLLKKWIPKPISNDDIKDYLFQKTLFTNTLSLTENAQLIDRGLIRYILSTALQKIKSSQPSIGNSFEPIIISGDIFSQIPDERDILLSVLDGIQPEGITTIIVDKLGIAGTLGAIAKANPLLPVQIIDSGIFTNLGTVICPVSKQKGGTDIINLRIDRSNGEQDRYTVKKGNILKIPLELGKSTKLDIQCLKDTTIDRSKKKRFFSIEVEGGQHGLIIDARSRPIAIAEDGVIRTNQLENWYKAIK